MRPLRLDITGLTTFAGRQVLDFTTCDDLFAILGPTGSGKSSILEAIAFALYGQMPKAEQQRLTVGDFIRTGQHKMAVVFDCEVRGQQIRITRVAQRSQSKAPQGAGVKKPTVNQTVLVERWDAAAQQWVPLDRTEEKHKRERDQQISDWLGMNYETFLRTVLLPQNQFAKFLHGTAKERTQVLEELWDVQELAAIGERARSRAKEVDGLVQRLIQDLARLDAYPESWLTETRERVERLQDELQTLTALQDRLAPLLRRLPTVAHERRSAVETVAQAEATLAAGQRLATTDAELVPLLGVATAEVNAAAQQVAASETVLQTVSAQLAERMRDAAKWRTLQSTLEQQRATASRVAAAERKAASHPAVAPEAIAAAQQAEQGATRQLAAAQAMLRTAEEGVFAARRAQHLAGLWADLTTREQDLATRTTAAQAKLAAGQQAVADATAALARAEQAWREATQSAHRHQLVALWQPGEPCPVCAQAVEGLTVEANDPTGQAVATATAAREAARATLASMEKGLAKVEAMVEHCSTGTAALATERAALEAQGAQHADPTGVATAEAAVAESRARLQSAEAILRDATRQLADLQQQHQRATDLAAQLAAEEAEAATAVVAVTAAAAALDLAADADFTAALVAHDAEEAAGVVAHQQAEQAHRAAVAALVGPERTLRDLEAQQRDTRARLAQLSGLLEGATEHHLFSLSSKVTRARKALEEAEKAVMQVQNEITAVVATAGLQLSPTDPDLGRRIADRQIALTQEASRTEETLRQAERLVAERPRLEAERTAAQDEQARLGLLAEMFRSDKFIAYYLSDGMATLTAHASRELDDMSEGRFQLTLDAKHEFRIVDTHTGAEDRPVGTLSGGETFLVSLALALGLSTAVQEQAGSRASAGLLLIDEGFGGLDRQSLNQAMEALERLQSRGHMVGVVTHVEEMGEQIPTGFRVEPGAAGSRVVPRTLETTALEADEGDARDEEGAEREIASNDEGAAGVTGPVTSGAEARAAARVASARQAAQDDFRDSAPLWAAASADRGANGHEAGA